MPYYALTILSPGIDPNFVKEENIQKRKKNSETEEDEEEGTEEEKKEDDVAI